LEALLELGVQVEQPDALEPHLVGFADTSSWKPAFATLVPRLQGWSSGEARAQILRGCDAVIGLAEFGERIKDLRARLREMQQAPEPLQEQAALAEARATLRELDERSAPWPDEDARVGKLKRALPRLRERLEQRPSARSAASALSTLLVGLGRGDDQDSARVARALQAALQGTRAGDGATAAPASAPEEAEPAPLPGRYTMRRKSIPFQRSRLVIRDEQMQALAAAQRRDLAVRLEAHARDERGAHERWGEERTHEIVAQCLDRAAELEISKFGAIRTLLDVMIVVDPAFTELDEYAWAKDLLESDMLEPNSKPGLIWDQLEV
ncbi:MAG TPA: hypothetical protein DEA08_28280, partial [Planctomycetes bacterium]|nr:hypothetical protein [Planctomycetota bacterium]